MNCPICKKEMFEVSNKIFHVCRECGVYYYPQIKEREEDTEYKSLFTYKRKSYSIKEFEAYCKLKVFW